MSDLVRFIEGRDRDQFEGQPPSFVFDNGVEAYTTEEVAEKIRNDPTLLRQMGEWAEEYLAQITGRSIIW